MTEQSKNSPGPWSIVLGDDYHSINSPCGHEVCTVDSFGSQVAADARLIAAAPELLKALVALSQAIESKMGTSDYGNLTPDDWPDMAKAQRAIEKATDEEFNWDWDWQ